MFKFKDHDSKRFPFARSAKEFGFSLSSASNDLENNFTGIRSTVDNVIDALTKEPIGNYEKGMEGTLVVRFSDLSEEQRKIVESLEKIGAARTKTDIFKGSQTHIDTNYLREFDQVKNNENLRAFNEFIEPFSDYIKFKPLNEFSNQREFIRENTKLISSHFIENNPEILEKAIIASAKRFNREAPESYVNNKNIETVKALLPYFIAEQFGLPKEGPGQIKASPDLIASMPRDVAETIKKNGEELSTIYNELSRIPTGNPLGSFELTSDAVREIFKTFCKEYDKALEKEVLALSEPVKAEPAKPEPQAKETPAEPAKPESHSAVLDNFKTDMKKQGVDDLSPMINKDGKLEPSVYLMTRPVLVDGDVYGQPSFHSKLDTGLETNLKTCQIRAEKNYPDNIWLTEYDARHLGGHLKKDADINAAVLLDEKSNYYHPDDARLNPGFKAFFSGEKRADRLFNIAEFEGIDLEEVRKLEKGVLDCNKSLPFDTSETINKFLEREFQKQLEPQAKEAPAEPAKPEPQAKEAPAEPAKPEPQAKEAPAEPAKSEPQAKEAPAEPAKSEPQAKEAPAEPAKSEPQAKETHAEPAKPEPQAKEAPAEPAKSEPQAKEAPAEPVKSEPQAKEAPAEAAKSEPQAKEAPAEPAKSEPQRKLGKLSESVKKFIFNKLDINVDTCLAKGIDFKEIQKLTLTNLKDAIIDFVKNNKQQEKTNDVKKGMER
ncbi:hypothetical protein [Anaerobiospirillum sp. NML120511]|uniref:hypothetical protein n=1 Tax=Anaerobiospirillum sp. NML120511 TaxID=2932819 RepID=UPI001FF589C1|nr:hypothetical protein [Anaerobiospirillum sp. NML120511]MCK0535211.1 hypothetical protein [Anaerobiospirillum sp. NML120511]